MFYQILKFFLFENSQTDFLSKPLAHDGALEILSVQVNKLYFEN